MKQSKKRGFTIVELVIVIAVVAILAAVLIPTFAGLIEKANTSVDMQIVNQMNTALQADEIVSGKPATVVEAKEILVENGCDDFTPADTKNVFYWVGSENRVIIWTKDDGEEATTGKVTYPKDLAKKYAGVTTPSNDWADLSVDYAASVIEVKPEEGETIAESFLDAVKDAENGAIIKLPANTELNIGDGAYYLSYQYLLNEGGTGKELTIDLNGGKLISNEKRIVDGEDEGYYDIRVPVNGTLTLANGSVEITTDGSTKAALSADTGAHLILRDINMTTNGAAVYPSGDASEVIIEGSKIVTSGSYTIGTTNGKSNNVRITVNNSEVTSTGSVGMLCNVPADLHIYNSKITGVTHGIALRAGHLEIENSTLVATDTAPGIFAFDNFAQGYGFNGYWGGGNTIPAGVLVVGDYAKANGDGTFSYAGEAITVMTNTKLQSAAPNLVPEILLAASDPAKTVSVTYDATSSVGRTVVYGEVWNPAEDNIGVLFTHPGTITVNGATKTNKIFNWIPEAVGTFNAGSEYSVNDLNVVWRTTAEVDHTQSVKDQIKKSWDVELSDTEWASAKLTFSSSAGNNQLKTITYTPDDAEEATTIGDGTAVGGSRITLKVGSLEINSGSYSNNSYYTNIPFTEINFVQPAQSFNYYDDFKTACAAAGITVTDSTKIVIGDTNNVIVDIK